jgi:hypothetical protein
MSFIVYDEEQIKRFYKFVGMTPVVGDESIYYMFLDIRKKYGATKDSVVSQVVLSNCTVEEFIKEIYKIELDIKYHPNRDEIENSCVLYCNTNPRSMKKAINSMSSELFKFALDGRKDFNIYHTAKSHIARSKGKTRLVTIDLDDKNQFAEINDILKSYNIEPAAIVETRGGYHFILKVEDINPLMFKKISDMKILIGDVECPIPGTIQGGFKVKFL